MDKFNFESLGIFKEASNTTGTHWFKGSSKEYVSSSPVDGKDIATVHSVNQEEYERVVSKAKEAFAIWKNKTAPERGEIVRQMGEALRHYKNDLGALVSFEMGKSLQEGKGEVQEMIDICDFAVGLSRQLYGLSMHSERPNHRMLEQWHPVGVVGIISAFNFPVAVWSWNAMIALVCGNSTIWKPSEKAPLSAMACLQIFQKVLIQNDVPEGLLCLIQGGKEVGEWLAKDTNIALVSATGSTAMGKSVAQTVGARLGKSLLELGGNNAIIITPNASLELVIPGVVFGAVGTCGQRCTSTRRLIVHKSLFEKVSDTLVNAYQQLKIGNPLDESNHVGPLIDKDAVAQFSQAIQTIKKDGQLLCGGELLSGEGYESGCYVTPAIAVLPHDHALVQKETFAPILYLIPFENLEDAISIQNEVPQGLSSAIFTDSNREAQIFLSANGSDCGIANVNIGTSGAEIGGAFGGEKETGGGRESGSDSWKAYMRRQTCTINYGDSIPLAQGIKFNLSK